ncbi:hypothetical protein EW146_g6789, partial [Bondarzewia mesenterica]
MSEVGVTLVLDQALKRKLSIKLTLNGKLWHEESFSKGLVDFRCELDNVLTLQSGSNLSILYTHKNKLGIPVPVAKASVLFRDAQQLIANGTEHKLADDARITVRFEPDAEQREMLERSAARLQKLSSVLDRLGKSRQFVEILLDFGVAASELHPTAKAVLAAVKVLHDRLKNQQTNDGMLIDLVHNMTYALRYIEVVHQFAELGELKTAMDEVGSLVERTSNFVAQYASRGATRTLTSLSDQETVEDLNKEFLSFKERFTQGLQVQSSRDIAKVRKHLEGLVAAAEDEKFLQVLRPTDLRPFERDRCLPDTRKDILAKIHDWLHDFTVPNILLVMGVPGVGKSAVAATMADKLRRSRFLVSSFAFDRNETLQRTPVALWRTVASDLAKKYPSARALIAAKLRRGDLDLGDTTAGDVFSHLVQEPLQACTDFSQDNFPVVIIDALDECGGLDGSRSQHRKHLLQTIKSWSSLSRSCKLIVTSRAEGDIMQALEAITHLIELAAGDRVNEQSSKDIRLYIENRFSEIVQRYPRALSMSWPGSDNCAKLTARAAGLFIWAKTALDIVDSGQPPERLKELLNEGLGGGGIYTLYQVLLQTSFAQTSSGKIYKDDIRAFNIVVGAIIFAKTPLRRSDLISLLGQSPIAVDFVCDRLQSVLDNPSLADEVLRFNHASFADYLLAPECPDMFRIERMTQEQRMALNCFRVMEAELRFNICNLETSHLLNDDVHDLSARVERAISPSLSYSCRFWADHLRFVKCDGAVLDALEKFLHMQFLFWLEAVSLLKEVSTASQALKYLMEWSKIQDISVYEFAADALKFVSNFGTVISQSATHIYLSALPFAPKGSPVMRYNLQRRFSRLIVVEAGGMMDWPVLQMSMGKHTSWVNSVAFSPDGKHIVSGSGDKTIRVWDAETGAAVSAPFEGHTLGVTSVAFSPDGKRIVSGSGDTTIRVWDAETGAAVSVPFKGHASWVTSVAFSPDG